MGGQALHIVGEAIGIELAEAKLELHRLAARSGIAAILRGLSNQGSDHAANGGEVLLILRYRQNSARVALLEIPKAQSLNSTSPFPLFCPRRAFNASTSL